MKTMIIIAIILLMLLSACAPGSNRYNDPARKAGFFTGIWHGWIAPISLIVHFFNPNIRIYEPNNSGWTYDFGFYIAIVGGFGGLALSRKKKRKKD